MRKRRARRKAIGTRAPILNEAKMNPRWSLDFVHDQFASGQRFRILNILDDRNRQAEQGRSAGMAHMDSGTHRLPQDQPAGRADAVEL